MMRARALDLDPPGDADYENHREQREDEPCRLVAGRERDDEDHHKGQDVAGAGDGEEEAGQY